MLARNETIFKWTLYGAASLLCFLIQWALLQRICVWGAIPFVYPLVAVIPATRESPTAGTVFALAVGVVCDLLLPAPIPCLYTLAFPLAGLCASLLSQGAIRAGFLCSSISAAIAFLFTDLLQCLVLWSRGKAAWEAGAFLALRETAVTLPLVLPVTALFQAVWRRTHLDG